MDTHTISGDESHPADVRQYLGRQHSEPVTRFDLIPWTGGPVEVRLNVTEFTSLCPVTHQPDFGSMVITYIPRKSLVETKSLKLYMWQFREVGAFNEAITAQIADDFYAQVEPETVTVISKFNQRGGIFVETRATRGGGHAQ